MRKVIYSMGVSLDGFNHLIEPPSQEVGADLPRLLIVEPVQLLVRRRPVDLAAGPGD